MLAGNIVQRYECRATGILFVLLHVLTMTTSGSPLVVNIMRGSHVDGELLVVDGDVSGAVELYAPSFPEALTVLSWRIDTLEAPFMPSQQYSSSAQPVGSSSAGARAIGAGYDSGVSLYFSTITPEGIMRLGIDVLRSDPAGQWRMKWYEVQEHLTEAGISRYGWAGGSVRAVVSIDGTRDSAPGSIATPEPPVFVTTMAGVGVMWLRLLVRRGAFT
jgi:hypothetical protein